MQQTAVTRRHPLRMSPSVRAAGPIVRHWRSEVRAGLAALVRDIVRDGGLEVLRRWAGWSA